MLLGRIAGINLRPQSSVYKSRLPEKFPPPETEVNDLRGTDYAGEQPTA